MNKRQIKRWLSALRSGEWKQIHGVLTSGERHCCIHVAFKLEGGGRAIGTYEAANVARIPNKRIGELTFWNDISEHSFPEIADRIEEKLAADPKWLSFR